MHLQLLPLQDSDFSEVIPALWEAFENPYQGFFRTMFPILNNDRAASIAQGIELVKKDHKAQQPASNWLKVIDIDAGNKVVGGARWSIYENNPFESYNPEDFVAEWYPEGSMEREFSTKFLRQMEAPRRKRAQRPHLFLEAAFTIPSYRRRGISDLFMKWGIEKADAMGLECWLDSTDIGRAVYEKYGFIQVSDQYLDPQMPSDLSAEDQAELQRIRELIPPSHNALMWRPKGGKYIEGKTVKPWEEEE